MPGVQHGVGSVRAQVRGVQVTTGEPSGELMRRGNGQPCEHDWRKNRADVPEVADSYRICSKCGEWRRMR